MATVSYAAIHAPYQQAPQSLTPNAQDLSGVPCAGGTSEQTRTISNQMLEAMDTEIGRLLVEIGLASRNEDGSLQYNPSASNTMLVIIGDNGTYAPGVKAPFDLTHAKGYVNQTGVWVPLLVAGRLVNTPDRDVQHMVNVADLFQLFGEIAGLDVRGLVPPRAFSTRYRCCRISPTRDNRVCAAITSLRPASISRRTGSVRRRA
jgi:arylsulfatase A-like enzyme